ncbi:hypothetical protein O6R08_00115 [Cutibacterium equinum]|uniref:DUF3592 domain-containing protein n=1 Tax=Cutibacterium equinum TaxID=3016342 RepID=A0ABY7QYA8_9ACTN|nr:DUF3592 domain-containing protein [Cutibacterium equinum]WCC80017.1 hypothetical protein O6R08_00115 [Cutibacterium equinum]
MLFAVTGFKRAMAVLGVVYLVIVGCLYFVLADRSDKFLRDGQVIEGTVQDIHYQHSANTGATRYLMHAESGHVAVISYTYNGKSSVVRSNPYRDARKYRVGQKVDLVIQEAHPHDNVVMVRDHTILGMHVIPWAFLASAVVMTAWFWRDYLVSRRRRRRRMVSHRQTPSAFEGMASQ